MTKTLVYEIDLDLRELKIQLIRKVGWNDMWTLRTHNHSFLSEEENFDSFEEFKNTDVSKMTTSQKKAIMKEYFRERVKVNDIHRQVTLQYYPRSGKVYLRYDNPNKDLKSGDDKRTLKTIENFRENADPEVMTVLGPDVE